MLYQFANEKFVPIEWCNIWDLETLVADSFLVNQGSVIALDRHLQRFRESVNDSTDIEARRLADFERALKDILPRQGLWFPRIEAVATKNGQALRYRQRPSPKRENRVIVARAPRDPRRFPNIKGPDLSELMGLRRDVAKVGASEAIITTEGDLLVEGAYSSLAVWLADSNELTMIPTHTAHLPGVTEAIVQELAQKERIAVKKKDLVVSDLIDSELWILSSLHGIRVATAFIDGPPLKEMNGRREHWQDLWESCAIAL